MVDVMNKMGLVAKIALVWFVAFCFDYFMGEPDSFWDALRIELTSYTLSAIVVWVLLGMFLMSRTSKMYQ